MFVYVPCFLGLHAILRHSGMGREHTVFLTTNTDLKVSLSITTMFLLSWVRIPFLSDRPPMLLFVLFLNFTYAKKFFVLLLSS